VSVKKDASRRNIAAMARELAPLAMETISELLKSDQPNIRLDAAKHVLDRAIGKPIAMTADVTDRLDEFTDEQLDAGISELEARIAAVAKAAEQTESPPVTH
jgi:hypothetical protein